MTGRWLVNAASVRSIPSHVGTGTHRLDSWLLLLFCAHENIHLHFYANIRFPRGHRVHVLNSTIQFLYWSLYCTPMVFVYPLSLSVLDVFTEQGKSVSWDHMFTTSDGLVLFNWQLWCFPQSLEFVWGEAGLKRQIILKFKQSESPPLSLIDLPSGLQSVAQSAVLLPSLIKGWRDRNNTDLLVSLFNCSQMLSSNKNVS